MEYEMVELDELKPLEMVFPHHLNNLEKIIVDSNCITAPIIADREHKIVLDGSHRYVLFNKLGHKTTPVKFVDYRSSDVRVGSHLKHRFLDDGNIHLTKEEIVYRGTNGILLPPRTTRHFFNFRKNYTISVLLEDIPKCEPRDISKYIADVSLEDEIIHNLKYIQEINEEMEEVSKYLYEQKETALYLLRQIEMMKDESTSNSTTI